MVIAQFKPWAGSRMVKKEDCFRRTIYLFEAHFLNFSYRQGTCPILGISEVHAHHNDLPGPDFFPCMFTQYLLSQCHSHLGSLHPHTVSLVLKRGYRFL